MKTWKRTGTYGQVEINSLIEIKNFSRNIIYIASKLSGIVVILIN